MTAQIPQTVVVPESVLTALQILSPERQQQVFDFVEFLAQKQKSSESQVSPAKRIKDLDRGAVLQISDDFDEPLPDEFWFGENDPLMMTDEQIQQINHLSQRS